MKLSPDVATELAQLRSNIAAMVKDEKELTKNIKDAMEKEKLDEYNPKESPYKLCRDEAPRSSVSWKDEWIRLAKKRYQNGWKRVMLRLQKESEQNVISLRVEPNENYVKEKS